MPEEKPLTVSEAWLAALGSDLGVALSTDNPELLRQHLYNHKYQTGDLRLEAFEITIPDGVSEVRIFRRDLRAKILGRKA